MKKPTILPVLIITLGLLGCKDDDGMTGYEIEVTRIDNKINLLNTTDKTLYYFLTDQNTLANWVPGIGENQDRLAPRGQARIQLSEITGYSDDTEIIIVYYWEAVLSDGQQVSGPILSIKYRL